MARNGLLGFASSRLARLFGPRRAVVLKYHRVLPEPDPMRPGETTAREFDAQMSVVAAAFRSRTLGELVRARRDGDDGEGSVVVTFDDGYRDNHDVALPILAKHGVRATFFVSSGYLDGGMMWNDRLLEALRAAVGRAVDLGEAGLGRVQLDTIEDASRIAHRTLSVIKRWPQERRARFVDDVARACGGDGQPRIMMTPAEVAALAAAGMEIGGHTVTHPILSTLSAEDARREIAQGKAELERIVGRPLETFAYPNGRPEKDFTDADVARVREAGFSGAVTTRWACATPADDPFLIPRQGIWGASRAKVWAQLVRNFRG